MITTCTICGAQHERQRASSSPTCSSRCRQTLYRRRKADSPGHLAAQVRRVAERADELAAEARARATPEGHQLAADLERIAMALRGSAAMFQPEQLF